MSLDLYISEAIKCEQCGHLNAGGPQVFERNITHNVVRMWDKAGVYDALYMSDGKRCGDYLPALEGGVDSFHRYFAEYEDLNPANGWGSAQAALEFLVALLVAVREHPDGYFRVSK